ncbi:hypothetical protein CCACVL1_00051 [Corchorus capsularis]|uniref:Uncharacterized protein n=1 Tax=Corchorus capsularis TaxID=210143 RepID=A0A1R3KYY2_COCAP|nr:hypothetical protein CCACVL1_00051 [Corchorus capsularis]
MDNMEPILAVSGVPVRILLALRRGRVYVNLLMVKGLIGIAIIIAGL